MDVFDSKDNVEYFVRIVFYEEVVGERDYNLLVSSYVEVEDICEVIDII